VAPSSAVAGAPTENNLTATFILKFDPSAVASAMGNLSVATPDLPFAATILEKRLAGLAITGHVSILGDHLLVTVPANVDRQRIATMLTQPARLTFQMVDEAWDQHDRRFPQGDQLAHSADPNCAPEAAECRFALKRATGDMVETASQSFDWYNHLPEVAFRLNEQGKRVFREMTTANVGKRFAAVLDGKVLTAPVIESPITGGEGVIQGSFTVESATDLAVLLRSGQLPARLIVVEQR
jgi:protein-export membrane protein SecD